MREKGVNFNLEEVLCYSDLYQHPLVQAVLGNSWHPGGLPLTRTIAKHLQLSNSSHLLDIASGSGASAIMLAQMYKCRVTGVDISNGIINKAREKAKSYRLDGPVTFVEKDASQLPFNDGTFDSALCECATSFFTEKRTTLAEIARVLRPGGLLALSDVTFIPDVIPQPFDNSIASFLCIPTGMGPDSYRGLIEDAGLRVVKSDDCSWAIEDLLVKIESLLGLGRHNSDQMSEMTILGEAAKAIQTVRLLLQRDELGYWSFIASKP